MSQESALPPRCKNCGTVFEAPTRVCPRCGADQFAQTPIAPQRRGQPKSAGVAVLLSFLLLGAGHLYMGRTGAGIALIVLDVFLWLLALTLLSLSRGDFRSLMFFTVFASGGASCLRSP